MSETNEKKTQIHVLLSGVCGKMGRLMAERLKADPRFELLPYALEADLVDDTFTIGGHRFTLVSPRMRNQISIIKEEFPDLLVLDFTAPEAVDDNVDFYCRNSLPFVLGTTGGNRTALKGNVENANIAAVIAPNMSKHIVWMQSMLEHGAELAPGLFPATDWKLTIFESHQEGKRDFSGTAIDIANKYFEPLGLFFNHRNAKVVSASSHMVELMSFWNAMPNQGMAIRDSMIQKRIGVPEEHLGGHAWHFYLITSVRGDMQFGLLHCINGRGPYVEGAVDALLFLEQTVRDKISGVYTMQDVIKASR